MLTGLFGGGHPVTAVGDPLQAIYGFRGASVANIDDFPQHFPRADGRPAPTLTLAENRRSGVRILDAANELAGPLRALHPQVAPLVPPAARAKPPGGLRVALHESYAEEIGWVADRVAEVVGAGTAPADVAILCRARSDFPAAHARARRARRAGRRRRSRRPARHARGRRGRRGPRGAARLHRQPLARAAAVGAALADRAARPRAARRARRAPRRIARPARRRRRRHPARRRGRGRRPGRRRVAARRPRRPGPAALRPGRARTGSPRSRQRSGRCVAASATRCPTSCTGSSPSPVSTSRCRRRPTCCGCTARRVSRRSSSSSPVSPTPRATPG